jgi:hypothetical protein
MIDEHCCDDEVAIDAGSDRIVVEGLSTPYTPPRACGTCSKWHSPTALGISGSQFRIDP